MERVYMDYAATTPVDPLVLEKMIPYFDKFFGNSSSMHKYGRESSEAVEKARGQVSDLIGCEEEEIIFTSGGTEADNLAIKGIAYNNKQFRSSNGYNIVTSCIEHPAVKATCMHLEKQGFKVRYVPVDEYGVIDLEELENAISKDTFLISVMFANNEIGTIQPLSEIGKIAREYDVLFHSDAVQAVGKVPFDVDTLNIDMLSVSSHKIYGPKGCGCLYARGDVDLQPIFNGGGHEQGLRSSTLNTPGVVGLGKACEILSENMEIENQHIKNLRNMLIDKVLEIDESRLNGHPQERLVNNAHFCFSAIEGESITMLLDDKDIAAATGSACSSNKIEPSHVLTSIGLRPEQAHGSLRLSLGRFSTKKEVDYVVEVLPRVVDRLRQMSPLWGK